MKKQARRWHSCKALEVPQHHTARLQYAISFSDASDDASHGVVIAYETVLRMKKCVFSTNEKADNVMPATAPAPSYALSIGPSLPILRNGKQAYLTLIRHKLISWNIESLSMSKRHPSGCRLSPIPFIRVGSNIEYHWPDTRNLDAVLP